jgi:hypothetical protein
MRPDTLVAAASRMAIAYPRCPLLRADIEMLIVKAQPSFD